jgi:hypothetical protein
MNRILILIGTCLTLCVTACASSPPTTPRARHVASAATQPPSGCVAGTATRISLSPGDCAAFGHVWTYQDLKGTGGSDTAHALDLLDPTLTIGH